MDTGAAGGFDPTFTIDRLGREDLCVLGREWLLHGHLQDRVGMPLLLEHCDRETMQQVAIDEWMAASPVYSLRMQRALGFGPARPGGRDGGVDVIFKNMQLDIGAPHQFLDFRYRLHGPSKGEFFLASCGALLDVEPMGEEFVRGMCHTIEDPTFDATAGATNPHAKVRPVHRPPRVPPGRRPHCRWTVEIGDGPPARQHENLPLVAASLAATVTLPRPEPVAGADTGGRPDYSGDFDPLFEFEDLSHTALRTALGEIALQSHLLFRSFLIAVGRRFGTERVRELKPRMLAGLGGLTSQRLCRALRIGGGAAGVGRLLQVHPMVAPAGYVDAVCEPLSPDRLRFALRDCPMTREPDGLTWLGHLDGAPAGMDAFGALVQGADPRARARRAEPRPGERLAVEVTVDPDTEPAPEPPEVRLAKLSGGASFVFRRRRPPRED
ncbi:hypothetical protein Acsp03_01590 [Actinomadura sp. NBRC 104412]|uniref:hypothetical protein n=1 Tax=Actinomadura sp. NBRC 104412 TaxID=3032203 RepID=UPI0024A503BE|nr:hypothetical protein [Actinomadura sp. NBRC 104412]GLZ02692.1 hypothetical protein Acsp03_01590 [Actinomadura sp. NBRC 104412]